MNVCYPPASFPCIVPMKIVCTIVHIIGHSSMWFSFSANSASIIIWLGLFLSNVVNLYKNESKNVCLLFSWFHFGDLISEFTYGPWSLVGNNCASQHFHVINIGGRWKEVGSHTELRGRLVSAWRVSQYITLWYVHIPRSVQRYETGIIELAGWWHISINVVRAWYKR